MESPQTWYSQSPSYGPVEIYMGQPLGKGSYGRVCRAKCGQLPCAAKLLHDTLFLYDDPGVEDLASKFKQECEFLRSIKHPNVVQYLDTVVINRRSVLLMELLDESLTKCLERYGSKTPLPCHVQVDICHDIALALAYLHSRDIVHRDLSSNNILLVAGKRAKVTDFGMSKLIDTHPRATPLTQVPGTQVYMSPEAITGSLVYSTKLDCFSFGVLVIQIATREFPSPENPKLILDPADPSGLVMLVIPEGKRRMNHIRMIKRDHPLLQTALDCIEEKDTKRPSASDLCDRVAAVKRTEMYTHSVELAKRTGGGSEHQAKRTGGGSEHQLTIAVEELRVKLRDNGQRERQLADDYKTLERELNDSQRVAERYQQEIRDLGQRLGEREHDSRKYKQRKDQELASLGDKLRSREQEVLQLKVSKRELEVSHRELEVSHRELEVSHRELNKRLGRYERENAEQLERYKRENAELRQALQHKTGQLEQQLWRQSGQLRHLERRLSEKDARLSEHQALLSDVLVAEATPEQVTAEQPGTPVLPLRASVPDQWMNPAPMQPFQPPGPYMQPPAPAMQSPAPALRAMQPPISPIQNPSPRMQPPAPAMQPPTPAVHPLPVQQVKPVPDPQPNKPAPDHLTAYSGQVTVHGTTAYFSQNHAVYAYHQPHDSWEELPRCEQKNFAVAFVKKKLTAIGGLNQNKLHTDVISSFTAERKWDILLPPLPTARVCPGVVTTPTHLVVACGMYVADDPDRSHKGYASVDLMTLDSLQWSAVSSLPVSISHPQLKHITGQVYLSDMETNQIYKCSLERLFKQVQDPANVWVRGTDLPVQSEASLVVVGRELLAMGGKQDNGQPSRAIYSYDSTQDQWTVVGRKLQHARSWALTAVCGEGVVMVVGGFGANWASVNDTEKIRFP